VESIPIWRAFHNIVEISSIKLSNFSYIQIVQKTFYLVKSFGGDMGINLGSFWTFMPQKALDVPQVGSSFRQMGCERVHEGMNDYFLFNTRF
jgi:hypothetical protein